jgi:hypothetical protein
MIIDEEFAYVAEQVDRLIWWFLPRYAGGFAADSESYISIAADGQVRRGPAARGPANGAILAELQLSSQDFFIKAIEFYCQCDNEKVMRNLVYHMTGAVTQALVAEAMSGETAKLRNAPSK